MRLVFLAPYVVPLFLLLPAIGQSLAGDDSRHHDSEAWKTVESHLPNPATASAATLEMQGDILRVRRFPADAIDFYNYALARGGATERLLNKLGLAELEMHNNELGLAYFARAVKVNKKDPQAWNNLGATEYVTGNKRKAISSYKKAIKLNPHLAVSHANISSLYFEQKNYPAARREIATALGLDPTIFERRDGEGGIAAQVLSQADRARFAFEMARMYAEAGLQDSMLHSLAVASESGMDIQPEMRKDPTLVKFADDPRVVTLVETANALRASPAETKTPAPPALASAANPSN